MTDSPYVPRRRLFVDDDLAEGAEIALGREQSHYLVNVMRARPGQDVGLFNGREGEWQASLAAADRRSEEHTSELQSLMHISYAVFYLNTKYNTKHLTKQKNNTLT